jgi:hypothetical protein
MDGPIRQREAFQSNKRNVHPTDPSLRDHPLSGCCIALPLFRTNCLPPRARRRFTGQTGMLYHAPP